MPTTRTCDFSGDEIEPGTGIVYVRTDGTILTFKDSKAEKNYFLGREGRNTEWTSIAHEGDEEAAAAGETAAEAADTGASAPAASEPTDGEGGLGDTLEELEESEPVEESAEDEQSEPATEGEDAETADQSAADEPTDDSAADADESSDASEETDEASAEEDASPESETDEE